MFDFLNKKENPQTLQNQKSAQEAQASDTTAGHHSTTNQTNELLSGKEEVQAEASEQPLSTSSPAEPDFDALIEQEGFAETGIGPKGVANVAVPTGRVSKDAFKQSFIGMHAAAKTVTGIQSLSLPNARIDAEQADEIAETLFECIEDIPMLHFMLEPNNKWIGRGFVMFMYVQGMRAAVSAELRDRQPQTSKEEKPNFAKAKAAQKTGPTEKGEPDAAQVAALTGAQ